MNSNSWKSNHKFCAGFWNGNEKILLNSYCQMKWEVKIAYFYKKLNWEKNQSKNTKVSIYTSIFSHLHQLHSRWSCDFIKRLMISLSSDFAIIQLFFKGIEPQELKNGLISLLPNVLPMLLTILLTVYL